MRNRDLALIISDSGIGPAVGDIDDKVSHQDSGGDDQTDALDIRIVLVQDGADSQSAHAGDIKDGLDEDGAADDHGDAHTG